MPRGLPRDVKKCLEKARDSALLAVETYNKPAIKFKSGGYIVLMTIAWTSLFHGVYFKRKRKPYYKSKNGRYEKRDGDYCYWELGTCLKHYYKSDTEHPIRKNLEFFIPLRNMVEHKSIPELDSDIFAECQSMLLNFDKVMEHEFGLKYCIRESLSFALQLYPSAKSLNSAIINNPSNKPIIDFIKSYRSSISTDTVNSGEYAFKAFLIQVANHESKNTVPIQFVQWDKLDEVQQKNVNRIAAVVKSKYVEVAVSNKGKIKPSEVVKKVQAGLGDIKVKVISGKKEKEKDKFNSHCHTQCWKHYKVRPDSNSSKPELTDSKYCVYDSLNQNYGYTDEWVDFLIDELSDPVIFEKVIYGKSED